MKGTATSAAEIGQGITRLPIVAAALEVGGIDAMGLAASDWSVGKERLFALAATHHLPILAANLSCDGTSPFPPSTVVERGGHRIGIVGVTAGRVSGCEVSDPAEALTAAIAGLGTVDAVLAIVPLGDKVLASVLGSVDGITLAFDANGSRAGDVADHVGNTWVVGSGSKGAMVGLTSMTWGEGSTVWAPDGYGAHVTVELERAIRRREVIGERVEKSAAQGTPTDKNTRLLDDAISEVARLEALAASSFEGTNQLHTELVKLDDAVGEHAATQAIVGGALSTEQKAVAADVVAPVARKTRPGSPYGGSDRCRVCHADIGEQWASTAHARAWQTLVDDDHAADAACFACHSTGAHQPGGPKTPAMVQGLRDVQCEACHGPAIAHVSDPTTPVPVPVPDQAACAGCHEGERAMDRFDWPTYLPQITHKSTAAAGIRR